MTTVNLFDSTSFVNYARMWAKRQPEYGVVSLQRYITEKLLEVKKREWGCFACLVPFFFTSKIQAAVKVVLQSMGKLPSEPLKEKYRQIVNEKCVSGQEAFQLCLKEAQTNNRKEAVYSYLQKHLHLAKETVDYLLSKIDAKGDDQLMILLNQLGFPVIRLRASTFNPLTFSLHILRNDSRFQNLIANQGDWIQFVRSNYPNIPIPQASKVKDFEGLIPPRDREAVRKELLALTFVDEIISTPVDDSADIRKYKLYQHLSEIFSDEQISAILKEMEGRVHGFRRAAIDLACCSDWLIDTGRLYQAIFGSLKTDPSEDDIISLGSRMNDGLGKIGKDKAKYFEKHVLTPAQKRVIDPASKIVEEASRMYRDQLVAALKKPAKVSKSFQADIDQQIKMRSDGKGRISTEQFAKDAHRFTRMRIFSEGQKTEFNDQTSTLEQVDAIYGALEKLSSGDETLLLMLQEMSSQSPKNFALNSILNGHSSLVSFSPISTYQEITKESPSRFSFIYEFKCKLTNMVTFETESIPLVVQYVLEKRGDAWAMGQPELLETETGLPSNKN